MFVKNKEKNLGVLAFFGVALSKTYNCTTSALELAIPNGYQIARLVLSNRGVDAVPTQMAYSELYEGKYALRKVCKGEIYLTRDLSVSFPLTQDEEVEDGHAVIVLRPVVAKEKPQDMTLSAACKYNVCIAPQEIYERTTEQLQSYLRAFGVSVIRFGVVRLGERYLSRNCLAIVTHSPSNNNRNERFVRLIVK